MSSSREGRHFRANCGMEALSSPFRLQTPCCPASRSICSAWPLQSDYQNSMTFLLSPPYARTEVAAGDIDGELRALLKIGKLAGGKQRDSVFSQGKEKIRTAPEAHVCSDTAFIAAIDKINGRISCRSLESALSSATNRQVAGYNPWKQSKRKLRSASRSRSFTLSSTRSG